jgi:predicted regulator of Ras-like GTPase activity (Roadblock/LC7/MglB family)
MQSILGKLNRTQGIRGSMVVNRDGIVVASDFSADVDETGTGAVASSILAALEGAVKRIKLGKLSRFVVTGSENKIAIVDAGPALLLVLLQRDVNMGMVNLEISEAMQSIVEKSKI